MGVAHHGAYVPWFEEARIECLRGLGQSARVTQRVHMPAAAVQHRAQIAPGAGGMPHRRRVQRHHRMPTRQALRHAGTQIRQPARVISGAQRAALAGLAANLVAADQIEHGIGRVARQRHHARTQISAEIGLDPVRVIFQPGVHLPAIAP